MDLALATGHGPPAVGDIEGRAPLVRADDAVLVGFRDGRQQVRDGSQRLPGALLALDLAAAAPDDDSARLLELYAHEAYCDACAITRERGLGERTTD